ncbi:hypothetical protein EDC04DRAFT_937825 [Pisolithus marmoratus]|nr:hypothetical protein EDC04DRAFT_937825 [Pisolithus marmoratus]
MSRFSQTLSLLGNLSSRTTAPLLDNPDIISVTEQLLPRRQDAAFGEQFVFQTNLLHQRIDARLLLLPPFPCDNPPFSKSVAYLSSRSGSIRARVYRLPGAEEHLFRLCIFARERGVKVTLPAMFRGVVTIKDRDLVRRRKQIRCSRAFRERMRCGLIRFDACASDNDDEVCIHADGKIELRLTTGEDREKHSWARLDRRVRRIFKAA